MKRMTYLVSISSRGLVYIPKNIQKMLKISKPGKLKITAEGKKSIRLEPVLDIFSLVGKLKAPKGKEFNLEEFRKGREEKYERL